MTLPTPPPHQARQEKAMPHDFSPVAIIEDLREVTLFLAGWLQVNMIWPEMDERVELLQATGFVSIGHRQIGCSQWVMDRGRYDARVTHWRKIEAGTVYNDKTQEELIALAHKVP